MVLLPIPTRCFIEMDADQFTREWKPRKTNVFCAAFLVSCLVSHQAKEAEGADNAVMLLTHLTTFIMMLQDERVSKGE